MIGGQTQDENGAHFCYGFNFGKCTAARPGGKCDKGWRKCMHKGLKEHHAYVGKP
jgi:hypothetical protein